MIGKHLIQNGKKNHPEDVEVPNCETLDQWLAYVKNIREFPPFKPSVFYNEPGDMLEIMLSNECYYGKWITPQVTMLIGTESGEVVGVNISGIKKLINGK